MIVDSVPNVIGRLAAAVAAAPVMLQVTWIDHQNTLLYIYTFTQSILIYMLIQTFKNRK